MLFPDLAEKITQATYKEYLSKQNQARVNEQEKLYYYYTGEKDKILGYLNTALAKTYDPEDIAWMQMMYTNITEKLVNQMSVVYRKPPERKIMKDDKEIQEMTKYYNNTLMPRKLNTIDKKAHRLGKLLNTDMTMVYFNPTEGLGYRVFPSHLITVIADGDNMQILMYDKYFLNEKGRDELYTVVWTDEEHFLLDQNGNRKPVGDKNDKYKNPYGEIPFPKLQMEEPEGFWGEGMSDVVNVNEQVNFLLTSLWNDNIILGTTGTPIAINLGLDKKGEKGEGTVRKIAIGRKRPISIDGVHKDMMKPSLEFASSDPHIVEVKDTIDWTIKMIASMKGLNPNSILGNIKDTSDYQKMMDALDQIEIRSDDLESCREYEKDRFDITRKVNNYWAEKTEGKSLKLKKINEDLELKVDFAEIEIPMSNKEKWEDRKERESRNMNSALDWVMKDNPDIKTVEEAQKILDDNRGINTTSASNQPKSIFESLKEEEKIAKEKENA